jgi:hypothetical protein
MCIHLPQKKTCIHTIAQCFPRGHQWQWANVYRFHRPGAAHRLFEFFFWELHIFVLRRAAHFFEFDSAHKERDRAQSCKAQRSPNQFAATSDWVRGDNEINVLAAQITCHQASRCTWSGAHPHPNSSSVVFLTKWSAFVQEFEEVGEKRYQFFFCLSSRCLQLHETDIRQKPLTLQNRGTTVPKLLAHIKIRSK